MAWVRARIYFASLYSYRVPDTSPSFALASPVPSPLAIRLALVDAAIQGSGLVDDGRDLFERIKTTPLWLVPPAYVSVVRVFIRRLKKQDPKSREARARGQETQLVESTGIREYCHPLGPLEVYLAAEADAHRLAHLFTLVRRLGTTDSLVHCVAEVGEEPAPEELACRRVGEVPVHLDKFRRSFVVPLLELPREATFDDVNPYATGRRGFRYDKDFWVLPLVQRRRGENWILYERMPFRL
ncbi:MAG: hypothetical protein ACUVSP_10150 [Desulfotomaculales bacterium]